MERKESSPPPMYAGHILPRYIELTDKPNLQRVRAKVRCFVGHLLWVTVQPMKCRHVLLGG